MHHAVKITAGLIVLPLICTAVALSSIVDVGGEKIYSGLSYESVAPLLAGQPTIDPNYGFTSQALGRRAALDVLNGRLPLWNHYEGFGTPLLGEMQSAALFPLTWLHALPNGQAIAQCLLQLFGGIGAYLFFRRLQIAPGVALIGALLFELNGVFAWLRNAAFNPVACLPWLFLVVENAFCHAGQIDGNRLQRYQTIALGGLVASLSLYAGFPETVYFYALLLVIWVAFRFIGLARSARIQFLIDLVLIAALALAISLPVLLAFLQFLPDAALGGHQGDGFTGAYLPSAAVLQYMLPYIYGPIFASTNPVVQTVWASIGGYVGLVPVIVACLALLLPERRTIKLILAGWIVVSVGVSQGFPVLHSAFMLLPLAKLAAACRYLNPSWIFCFIFLVVLALDEMRRTPWARIQRDLRTSIVIAAALVAGAAVLAWPTLSRTLRDAGQIQLIGISSLCAAALMLLGVYVVSRRSSFARIVPFLGALAVTEATVNFAIPYLSFPSDGRVDTDTIDFLTRHTGYQRVLATETGPIAPNYGSYYGFSTINWDDLPVPKMSVDYVIKNLDRFVFANLLFLPSRAGLTDETLAQRRALLRARLARYADVGVKYVSSASAPGSLPLLQTGADLSPLVLKTGERVDIGFDYILDESISVTSASAKIGTFLGQSDGRLAIELCRGEDCVRSEADIGAAIDNALLTVRYDRALRVSKGDHLRLSISKASGNQPVAVWSASSTRPSENVQVRSNDPKITLQKVPVVAIGDSISDQTSLVHRGKNFNIYELKTVRPYVDAPNCQIVSLSRDSFRMSCDRPSTLTRLELAMPGWTVDVNGNETLITTVNDIFQSVPLPAGESRVRFTYEPRLVRASAWVASVLALLSVFLAMSVFFTRGASTRPAR